MYVYKYNTLTRLNSVYTYILDYLSDPLNAKIK